jgi:DNA polymerase II small subunit/DNA polymerase delta subunit B
MPKQRQAKPAFRSTFQTVTELATSVPAWLDLPEPRGFRPKRKVRTVWISDIHLGTRGCNAAMLLDFLASIECETLYLVGDIVDGWRLKRVGTGRMPTTR